MGGTVDENTLYLPCSFEKYIIVLYLKMQVQFLRYLGHGFLNLCDILESVRSNLTISVVVIT